MIETLLSAAFIPFSLALAVLFGLLFLELASQLIGLSLLSESDAGIGADGAAEAFDVLPGQEIDIASLIEASEAPSGDADTAASSLSPLAVLGIGRAPFILWLTAFLLGFGLFGMALQSILLTIVNAGLPPVLAALAALPPGLAFARWFSGIFARVVPSVETSATSIRFLGGLRGTVTQGLAQRGSPAEVRVRDRHGNLHYLRCEPFLEDELIPEGSEVLTLRQRRGLEDWDIRIVRLC